MLFKDTCSDISVLFYVGSSKLARVIERLVIRLQSCLGYVIIFVLNLFVSLATP